VIDIKKLREVGARLENLKSSYFLDEKYCTNIYVLMKISTRSQTKIYKDN